MYREWSMCEYNVHTLIGGAPLENVSITLIHFVKSSKNISIKMSHIIQETIVGYLIFTYLDVADP